MEDMSYADRRRFYQPVVPDNARAARVRASTFPTPTMPNLGESFDRLGEAWNNASLADKRMLVAFVVVAMIAAAGMTVPPQLLNPAYAADIGGHSGSGGGGTSFSPDHADVAISVAAAPSLPPRESVSPLSTGRESQVASARRQVAVQETPRPTKTPAPEEIRAEKTPAPSRVAMVGGGNQASRSEFTAGEKALKGIPAKVEEQIDAKYQHALALSVIDDTKINEDDVVVGDQVLIKAGELLKRLGLDQGDLKVKVVVRSSDDQVFLDKGHFGEVPKALAGFDKDGRAIIYLANQPLSDEIIFEEIGHACDPNLNTKLGERYPELAQKADGVFFGQLIKALNVLPATAGEVDMAGHFSDFEKDIFNSRVDKIGQLSWSAFSSGVDPELASLIGEDVYYLDRDKLNLILESLPQDSHQRKAIEWILGQGKDHMVRQMWGVYVTRLWFEDPETFMLDFPELYREVAYLMDFTYLEYRQEGFAKMFVRMHTNPGEARKIYPKDLLNELEHLEEQTKLANNRG